MSVCARIVYVVRQKEVVVWLLVSGAQSLALYARWVRIETSECMWSSAETDSGVSVSVNRQCLSTRAAIILAGISRKKVVRPSQKSKTPCSVPLPLKCHVRALSRQYEKEMLVAFSLSPAEARVERGSWVGVHDT